MIEEIPRDKDEYAEESEDEPQIYDLANYIHEIRNLAHIFTGVIYLDVGFYKGYYMLILKSNENGMMRHAILAAKPTGEGVLIPYGKILTQLRAITLQKMFIPINID